MSHWFRPGPQQIDRAWLKAAGGDQRTAGIDEEMPSLRAAVDHLLLLVSALVAGDR